MGGGGGTDPGLIGVAAGLRGLVGLITPSPSVAGTSMPATENLNLRVEVSCFFCLSRLDGSNSRPLRGVSLKSLISLPTLPDLTVLLTSSMGDIGVEGTTSVGEVTEEVGVLTAEAGLVFTRILPGGGDKGLPPAVKAFLEVFT